MKKIKPLSVWVPGAPKAQPRPRRSANGGVYTPDSADRWKSAVAGFVTGNKPPRVMQGPIEVELIFHMPRPARLNRKSDPAGVVPAVTKADVDNLAKAVLDAITQTGVVWSDDNQVWRLTVVRWYAAKKGETGCWIHAWETGSREEINETRNG